MKILILAIIFAISSTQLFAQKNLDSTTIRPLNSFSINMFGSASISYLGFEGLFMNRPDFFFSGKVGFGLNQEFKICVWGTCDKPDVYFTIPHHVTANFGKGKHFIEMGVGGTIIEGNITQHYQVYPILGYRFQPLKPKKLNFRIFGCYPLIPMHEKNILFIPIGISVGYCF
ncbi:MAG: hypothetical protein WCR42_01150 [bacterium]